MVNVIFNTGHIKFMITTGFVFSIRKLIGKLSPIIYPYMTDIKREIGFALA